MYSLGAWCGEWVAPVEKYRKNGLSGVSAFCDCIQRMAWLVMSVVKW